MHEADNKLLKNHCSTSSLIAFKPRQVVLAEQLQKSKSGLRMMKKQEQQLNHKPALIHSILNYLQKNGFLKTFKRFLKEAQIEDDNWKTSFDLEDVYSRFLENGKDVDKSSKAQKEQDFTLEKGFGDLSEEAISKKKKKDKRGLENDEGDGKGESEETAKSKDKKEKQKLRTISFVEDGVETKKDSHAAEIPLEDCKTEFKKRKKKKEVVVSKRSSDNGEEMVDQGKSLESCENGAKESKKRKLSASDESENKPKEKSATGEFKSRKTEDKEYAKVGVQQGKLNAEANGHVDQKEPRKSSKKEVDGSTKGDVMKNGIERSAEQKSVRKQRNGSAEPKTAANAFQRVKVDEVKFADDRLQDNSYWGKDGAEYGYGARAQEILGQVKGRDFRHEKTKKKRGSYRGGQIDFQSHSIKFNYDEEE